MTHMNLPFPLDWREITRLKDNTRIVFYVIDDRFGVVTFNPDNTWVTPTTFDDELNAFDAYAMTVEVAKATT